MTRRPSRATAAAPAEPAPTEGDGGRRNEARFAAWEQVIAAFAGHAPLPVTVTMGPDGAILDAGVWRRQMRPHRLAPTGSSLLHAVGLAATRFDVTAVHVHADDDVAEFLVAAAAAADQHTMERSQRLTLGGYTVEASNLASFAALRSWCDITVGPATMPTGLVGFRERLRFGAGAEAAYHAFCERSGALLVSTDGAACPDRGDWAWAWWCSRDRWAAGGGYGGSSIEGELVAATRALEAHPDIPLALTYDCKAVGVIGRGNAARAAKTATHPAAAEMLDALAARSHPVTWLPLSSGSTSRRQWYTDEAARNALASITAGHAGPWSPTEHPPALGRRRTFVRLPS